MPGVSRNNDTAGGDLIPSQNTVFANGKAIIINGNSVAPHGLPPHASATMVAGSNRVFVHGKKVVNAGDNATCGHSSSGSSDVNVGD